MTETLIWLAPVLALVAVALVIVFTYLKARVDNVEAMIFDLVGELAEKQYQGNHPAGRHRRISAPHDSYDPFSDEGVIDQWAK